METKVISSCGFSNYNKENQSKIVVLGGSFNPPTTAHLALMKAAVDAAGAQLGLFVPTPFWYVEKKIAKTGHKEETLPDELRIELLNSMCSGDKRLAVDSCELQRQKGERSFTYETLEKIQEKYPESQVFFLPAVINSILFHAGTVSKSL